MKNTHPTFSALTGTFLAMAMAAAVPLLAPSAQADQHEGEKKMSMVDEAVAVLIPTKGNDVTGAVQFVKDGDKVRVKGKVTGLTPGKHGFHVHQYGDITAADGTSAGGHFNPEDAKHAGPDDEMRHVGDLGNITANEDGVAEIDITDSKLALNGAHSILGRALVVHAGEDDLTSQPSGDAGARVAVGVIGVMNPDTN